MYHIYFPEKHKVYRIGIARVEDGEGLGDPHDAPCLEDRVPSPDVEASDHLILEDEDETSVREDRAEDDVSDAHSLPVEKGSCRSQIYPLQTLQANLNLRRKTRIVKTKVTTKRQDRQYCPNTLINQGMQAWQSEKLWMTQPWHPRRPVKPLTM